MKRMVLTCLLAATLGVGTVQASGAVGQAGPQGSEQAGAAAAAESSIGGRFVTALAARDFAGARAMLAPALDFRAFTPSQGFLVRTKRDSLMALLQEWYGAAEAVEHLESGRVRERHYVDYRIRWSGNEGTMVFAQHAFYDLDGAGRISRMHLVCSGDQPVAGSPAPAA